ncbi:SCO family protein [Mesorhizobium sp. DCY119]|uniref:SCO family protein n=1 Tax=Mesorhizobium sp. DCY119 TaxID=2108445 RepID=UPI001FDF8C2A|nr:SCO family protein [Mesorhizobium sp. DCY119]
MLTPPAAVAQQPTETASTTAYDIGGRFSLTTQHGTQLSDADLKGKPYIVFFGFTHCPEVCPTTLFELTGALAALGPDADLLTPLFVTVDPERDTQEYLASYLGAFDSRIIGLSGSAEETAAIARSFKATYRKVPLGGDDYTMDHTAIIYLIDREGQFFDKIDYREDFAVQIEKLRRLVAAK